MNMFQLLLTQPLTNLLALFYHFFGNSLGLSIVLTSLVLLFAVSPLSKAQMVAAKKMKEIQPLVEKLKKKYKNDQKGLMTAQAELYRQKGINPSSGCLPYILQIVILIALFYVFTQVLSQNGDTINKLNSLLYAPLKFSESTNLNTGFLYLDIRKPDVFHLPGISFPIPGPLLILAGLLQFLSAKMNIPLVKKEEKIAKKTPGEADDMAVVMQSSMIYTFPLMTIIFGINFPSGLALYWLLFSVFQMYQQYRSSGWGGLTPFIQRIGLVSKV